MIRRILGEVSRSSVSASMNIKYSASMNIKYSSKVVGVVCWGCQEGFPEELVGSGQEFSGRRLGYVKAEVCPGLGASWGLGVVQGGWTGLGAGSMVGGGVKPGKEGRVRPRGSPTHRTLSGSSLQAVGTHWGV